MLRQTIRNLYYVLFRCKLRLRCAAIDLVEGFRPSVPPLPPAMLRYRVSEDISAREFTRVGTGLAAIIDRSIEAAGKPLQPGDRVLDFACGCGRTLAWLVPQYPAVEFHGADVDPEAIAWCRQNIAEAGFTVNRMSPPLDYPAAHFDIIYAVSVFTHLNEAMQDQWLAELHRVLKPGGLLLFSIHGSEAAEALPPADRQELQQRGFLYRQSKKLAGVVPDGYHTTWHSRPYILERVSRLYKEASYSATPGHLQDWVAARRME